MHCVRPVGAVQVYERGVDVFKFPVAFEIWNTYLTKFVKRYVRVVCVWRAHGANVASAT